MNLQTPPKDRVSGRKPGNSDSYFHGVEASSKEEQEKKLEMLLYPKISQIVRGMLPANEHISLTICSDLTTHFTQNRESIIKSMSSEADLTRAVQEVARRRNFLQAPNLMPRAEVETSN